MQSPCPQEGQLPAILAGALPEKEREAVENHLSACVHCQQALERLTLGQGDWLENARDYVRSDSSTERDEIVRRVKAGATASKALKMPPRSEAEHGNEKLTHLGEYRILGELGKGGMGIVFKARQPSLQRDIALKVILTGQFAGESQLRRFYFEAEAVARLDHPGIVPIYEIGEHQGRHFFTMKLIEGASLKERWAEFVLLPASESNAARLQREGKQARLVAAVARAVHHAHQRGILHRDLKPGNVLIDAEGQPQLTDFGLAKLLQDDSDLTISGTIMGTPEYMSPEQASGQSRLIATTSDVYSLGSILYELITGQTVFSGDDPMQVLQQVVREEPKPPRALNPLVSRDLETICLKCLEKEPSRRYSSAAALADDLDRFLRGEPILARPTSAPEHLWRWCRREPLLASSIASVVVVFLLGIVGVSWKWRGEMVQRERAEHEAGRARQSLAELEIEKALQAGNSGRGLASLARLVRLQPTNSVAAERLMNALTFRKFCLPVAPFTHGQALVEDIKSDMERTAFRREASITAVQFSPDGSLVLTASRDGTVRLWDGITGAPVGEPLQHGSAVLWAEFSPDGNEIVTGAKDGLARIWSTLSGKVLVELAGHRGWILCVAFSPNGERVVTASDDGTCQVWDASSGKPLSELRHQSVPFFATFSANGEKILSAQGRGPAVIWEGWDGSLKERISRLPHRARPEIRHPFPCFSPDNKNVLTIEGLNGSIFEPPDLEPVARLAHDDLVVAVRYSPDGRFVATGSLDGTVRLWRCADGVEQRPRLKHPEAIVCLEFGQDGRTLITGADDGAVRVWDIESGNLLVEPIHLGSPVLRATFSPDQRRIVTVSENRTAWLWDVPTSGGPVLMAKEASGVNYARFVPGSDLIVSLGRSGLSFYKGETLERIRGSFFEEEPSRNREGRSRDAIVDLDVSLKGEHVALALRSGEALILKADTQEYVARAHSLFGARQEVVGIKFSPDGQRVVTARADCRAEVWDLNSRFLYELDHEGDESEDEHRPKPRIHRDNQRLTHAEFSPDGALIVTASVLGSVRLWDANTGAPKSGRLSHEGPVMWAGFDPTGKRFASSSKDKTVRIWSAQENPKLQFVLKHSNAPADDHPAHFTPDGQRLVTVAGDAFQVWEMETGDSVVGPVRLTSMVLSARFSPDALKIVVACDDGAVYLFDARTGRQVGEPLRHEARVTYAEFNPNGTLLLTTSWDGHIRVWPVVHAPAPWPDWLPELAEAFAGEKIGEDNVSQSVPVERLSELGAGSQEPGTHYARWRRWYFDLAGDHSFESYQDSVENREFALRSGDDSSKEALSASQGKERSRH